MNKLKYLLFILTLVITTQGNTPIFLDVFAANEPSRNLTTDCGENMYSVDKIVGYDNFQKLACYSETEFSQAYQKMLDSAPNSVIRHNSSDSPLNIVAADRAIAYSMADTYLNDETFIYAEKDSNTVYTSIDQANSLYYFGTFVVGSPSTVSIENLRVLIEVNGARGYVKLQAVDIIPMIYVENRIDLTKDEVFNKTLNIGNSWYVAYQIRNSEETIVFNQKYRPNISYYIVAPISANKIPKTPSCNIQDGDLVFYTDTATGSFCKPIGKAPNWLPPGKYFSTNGINFYFDMDLKDPVLNNGARGSYYNYYNYLPLRSKTNYTASELNKYLREVVLTTESSRELSVIYGNEQLFIDAQDYHGMNALIILAHASIESNYGRSGYAQLPADFSEGKLVYDSITGLLIKSQSDPTLNMTVKEFCTLYYDGKYKDELGDIRYCLGRNNLFGWGAFTRWPNNAAAFESLAIGINEHMGRNLRFYLDAMNKNQYASNLGNKGVGINTRYAADPWWSVSIASLAYEIDRYLGLKDYNYYQLGILGDTSSRDTFNNQGFEIKNYDINLKAKNYPVLILEDYLSSYKVQSTNPIIRDKNSGQIQIVASPNNPDYIKPVTWDPTRVYKYSNETELYDWNLSFDFIPKSNISLINVPTKPPLVVGEEKSIISVREIKWLDSANLYVRGYSAFMQADMSSLNITHKITAIDLDDMSKVYDFQLNIASPEFELKLLYPYDYSKAWFDGVLNLSTLPDGDYRFEITTSSSNISSTGNFFNSLISAPRVNTINIGDTTYNLYFNNKASMRYELSKEKGLTDINRSPSIPSQIPSIATYTSLKMNGSILSIDGFSFINEVNMSDSDNVRHTLFIVSNSGEKYSYPLTTYKSSNLNLKGLDHSNAWLKNDSIDLQNIPFGKYKIYVFTETNQYSDLISIYDFRSIGNLSFDFGTKRFEFKVNTNQRNKYYLEVSEIIN